jgi:hypothetical protein
MLGLMQVARLRSEYAAQTTSSDAAHKKQLNDTKAACKNLLAEFKDRAANVFGLDPSSAPLA